MIDKKKQNEIIVLENKFGFVLWRLRCNICGVFGIAFWKWQVMDGWDYISSRNKTVCRMCVDYLELIIWPLHI